MAETSPNTDPNLFNAPEYEQYNPSYPDGMVQLAERYDQPDTVIAWEQHANTQTTDPEVAARRCAIITDESRFVYLLQGNRLYNVANSKAKGALDFVELDEHDAMPDITIGGTAPIFTDGRKVTSVLIATDKIKGDTSTLSQRSHATKKGADPFAAIGGMLEGLGDKPEVRKAFDPGVAKSASGLHAFASAFDHHWFGDGKKTTVPTIKRREDGWMPPESATNLDSGVRISPEADNEPGEPERVLDELHRKRIELGRLMVLHASEWPGIRFFTEKRAERHHQHQQDFDENVARRKRGQRPLPNRRRRL